MKIIKRLKSRLFWFRHWIKWSAIAVTRMHEWNSDILAASAEVEDQRKEIRSLRLLVENLEFEIKEMGSHLDHAKSMVDDKIEDAIDSFDVESKVENYLVYDADLSDHIDFEDLSEKTLVMMVQKLAEHV